MIRRRRIMGVSYLSQKWEARVPSEELVLLRAFVRRGHEAADDEQTIEMVLEELE